MFVTVLMLVGCLPEIEPTLSIPENSIITSDISGWVVYSAFKDNQTSEKAIFLKNLDTNEIVQLTDSGSNSKPEWSPDGEQILYLSWTDTNQYDINMMDKVGNNQKELLSTPANERMARWSPDGKNIVFVSDADGSDDIYMMRLETLDITRLTSFPGEKLFPAWSSDGSRIVFVSSEKDGRQQIFSVYINGENIQQLTKFDLDHFDMEPVWCPDDACIIFTRLDGPARLMFLDLATLTESYLLNGGLEINGSQQYDEGNPDISPVRGYLTFSVQGIFYAMDIETKTILPLNIQALDVSLYP
ncbi:MAG TPA: hypothetical protein PLT26_14890 [Anaerolineaceae bacterium]|nr:hypothetical protein [Anaerolineaceae bacterium]